MLVLEIKWSCNIHVRIAINSYNKTAKTVLNVPSAVSDKHCKDSLSVQGQSANDSQ